MPLPVGVETCTIAITVPTDTLGSAPKVYSGTVKADRSLIWAATGERLWPVGAKLPAPVDGVITFDVPIVDQVGWVDADGVPVTNWAYRAALTATWEVTRRSQSKIFQVFAATPSPVEIELLPTGATLPVDLGDPYVSSILGYSGVVTGEVFEDLFASIFQRRMYYTPKDFGAASVPGALADDQAAINSAMDAAASALGPRSVLVDGRYGWTGDINHRGGIKVTGGSRRRGLQVEDDLDHGLVALDGTARYRYGQWGGGNSENDNPGPLESLVIDGDLLGGDASALVVMECVDGTIRGCNIIRSAGDGVQVGSSQNSLIDDCFLGLAPNGTALRFKADHDGVVRQGAGQIKVTNTYLATSRYLYRIQGNDPANFHFPPHDITFQNVLCENYTAGYDVGVVSAGTNIRLNSVDMTVSQGTGPPPNDCVLLISQTEVPTWATTVEINSCLFSGGTQATKPTAGVIVDSTGGAGNHVHFTGRHSFQNVQACIAPKGATSSSVITNSSTAYRTQDGAKIPWYTTALGGSLFGTYTEWGTPLRFVMGAETGLQPPIQTRREDDAQDRFRLNRDGHQEWRNGADITTRGSMFYDSTNDLMALGRTWRVENAWALRPLTTSVSTVGQAVALSAAGTAAPLRYLSFVANNVSANITLNDGVDGSQYVIELMATGRTGCTVTWPSNIRNAPQPIDGQVVKVHLTKIGATDWWADTPAQDGWTYERLAADYTSTDDVNLTDVFTGFVPAPGAEYEIEISGMVSTAVSTTALVMSMDGPASPQLFGFEASMMTAASIRGSSALTTPGAVTSMASTAAGVTPFAVRGRCHWTDPGAGNVRLRGRSEVAASQVKIHAKAYMRWRRLP